CSAVGVNHPELVAYFFPSHCNTWTEPRRIEGYFAGARPMGEARKTGSVLLLPCANVFVRNCLMPAAVTFAAPTLSAMVFRNIMFAKPHSAKNVRATSSWPAALIASR